MIPKQNDFLMVRGAYGRTYKTSEQVIADWDAGKDFQIVPNGPYCSKRDDYAALGYTKVIFSLFLEDNTPILWKA